MGYYYNPPYDVKTEGRELDNTFGEFEHLTVQLKEGERLFALMRRDIASITQAVYVYDSDEYDAIEEQEDDGLVTIFGYYALPATMFDDYFGDTRTPNQQKREFADD